MAKTIKSYVDEMVRDFKATLDYWYAAQNPDNLIRVKEDWKEYTRIAHLRNGCAFCEYYMEVGEKTNPCKNCPLYKVHCSVIEDDSLTYYKLLAAKDFNEVCFYSRIIYLSVLVHCYNEFLVPLI